MNGNTSLRYSEFREGSFDFQTSQQNLFRHTHISFLAEQGVPLEAIQDRVGHNRGSRVTNIYLHVTQKTKDTITPLIDSLTQQ
ncbi:tyrosine-type recombinase/integrase [Streptococcus infantarius]|uniref:tyrosine-type recombinase/integrase n=1 Tax=Streptococcus infantarius TaxID=102684 RepID=UPI0022E5B11C|nr:tyrosine-type recombinase/integrase [Streptococcus infantarius]